MSTLSRAIILSVSTLAILSQACTLASPTTVKYEPAEEEEAGADEGATTTTSGTTPAPSGGAAATCAGKWATPDVSKLEACAGGKGHCWAKAKTPGGDRAVACSKADEVCVLDTVLKAAGGKLKSCNVQALSKPGACTALEIMPEAERKMAEGALKQDACAAGEVCAPCQNPMENNADTGLCGEVGVKEEACTGGGGAATAPAKPSTPAEACCGGEGACMELGAEIASSLEKDTCSGAKVCAPKSMAGGTPVKCNAGMIAGKGVCMGHCFNSTLDTASFLLKQDICKDTESCVPCSMAKKMAPGGVVPGCE